MRNDEQAEMSVLGAIILKPKTLNDAMKHIHGQNYFWNEKNKLVWMALMDMILSGKPIDYTTLCAKMACEIVQNKIEPNYFVKLTDCVPSPELCEHYAKIVAEEYRARELSRNAQVFFNSIEAKENETTSESWETLYSKAQEILSGNQAEEEPSIHTLANELADIKPETGWGTPWGIQKMDSTFHEISPGAIVVIGGRPGHNKTALALQLVDGWLARGKKVLYHSLEMTWREINIRRMARISKIPAWRIKRGYNYHRNIEDSTYQVCLDDAMQTIYNREPNLIIKDAAGLTPAQVALSIRMAHDTRGIDFVVIDHFHLLRMSGTKEDRFLRDEGLQTIVAACKARGITPIILAQLNRSIESEGRVEPKLSDLRECGALEEIATNVLFVYWPYKTNHREEYKKQMEIYQLKARDGETGKINLSVDPEIYFLGGV